MSDTIQETAGLLSHQQTMDLSPDTRETNSGHTEVRGTPPSTVHESVGPVCPIPDVAI